MCGIGTIWKSLNNIVLYSPFPQDNGDVHLNMYLHKNNFFTLCVCFNCVLFFTSFVIVFFTLSYWMRMLIDLKHVHCDLDPF